METTTTNESDAPAWAVIELMGHSRTGGLVSKDNRLGTAMLRVDVPQKGGGGFISQLVNPQSIYRLTFCEEAIARAAASQGNEKPLHQWELPTKQDVPAIETRDVEEEDFEINPFGVDEDHI